MSEIHYKSYPRFFMLALPFLGSVFFVLLSWFMWVGARGKVSFFLLLLIAIFSILSIICLYFLLTIRTVRLSKDKIRFSFLLLPFHRTLLLSDIKMISQDASQIIIRSGAGTRSSRLLDIVTTFELADNRKIKLRSIGQLDYGELMKCYNKLTRGNGKYSRPKNHFSLYLTDSFGELAYVVLLFILTTGLAWKLFHR